MHITGTRPKWWSILGNLLEEVMNPWVDATWPHNLVLLKKQQEVSLLWRGSSGKGRNRNYLGTTGRWKSSTCCHTMVLVTPSTSLEEKEPWLVLECWTLCWFEWTHEFCNTYGPSIDTINDIIAITMRENEEKECIKLAVIFCCNMSCCWPDVIHSKILFNMYINIKVLNEGKKPPLVNKCTICGTQLGVLKLYIVGCFSWGSSFD